MIDGFEDHEGVEPGRGLDEEAIAVCFDVPIPHVDGELRRYGGRVVSSQVDRCSHHGSVMVVEITKSPDDHSRRPLVKGRKETQATD